MQNYLPPRYRQRSVDRFVPVLEQLCTGRPVSFDPADLNLSVETALARLRDAVHALCTGKVTHTSIKPDVLRDVWSRFKATSDGRIVFLVSRKTEQGPTPPIAIAVEGRGQPLATLRATQPRFVESLSAFAVLLGQRILVGEVTVVGDLSDTLKQRLEKENDIVFRREANNTTIML